MSIKKVNQNIEKWNEYLESIKGYGLNTVDAYKRAVSEFFSFCYDM